MTDMTTHFAAPITGDPSTDRTMCGKPWEAVIMNDRPPTCRRCKAAHTPWTFPLPEVVV